MSKSEEYFRGYWAGYHDGGYDFTQAEIPESDYNIGYNEGLTDAYEEEQEDEHSQHCTGYWYENDY